VNRKTRLKRRLASTATGGLPCSIVSRRGKATGLSIIDSLASYRAEICPQAIRNGCRKQSTLDDSFASLSSELGWVELLRNPSSCILAVGSNKRDRTLHWLSGRWVSQEFNPSCGLCKLPDCPCEPTCSSTASTEAMGHQQRKWTGLSFDVPSVFCNLRRKVRLHFVWRDQDAVIWINIRAVCQSSGNSQKHERGTTFLKVAARANRNAMRTKTQGPIGKRFLLDGIEIKLKSSIAAESTHGQVACVRS